MRVAFKHIQTMNFLIRPHRYAQVLKANMHRPYYFEESILIIRLEDIPFIFGKPLKIRAKLFKAS